MQRRGLLLGLCSFLLISGCGSSVDFSEHYSDSGLIPEAYLPEEVGMVVSYSLRDSGQRDAVSALSKVFGSDQGFSRSLGSFFDSAFKDLGIEYERDLEPAFGDDFRFVYAASSVEKEEAPRAYSVVTLADPDKLASVFQVLVDAGQLEKKTVSGHDTYVSGQQSFYATIQEDVLLVASRAEDLQGMMDEKNSLWDKDQYQDALEKVGTDQLLYAVIFPGNYLSETQLSNLLAVGGLSSVLNQEIFVVRAETGGLALNSYAIADKEKAGDAHVSFDQLPHKKPYLYEEIPGTGLLGYIESYGLKQMVEASGDADGLKSLQESVRAYLGMDLDDLLAFLDKGYSFSLHENGQGLLPGLTVYIDISSSPDTAQSVLDKVDGQLQGLVTAFGSSAPGTLQKDTVDIDGTSFHRVSVDFSALPEAQSPLPTSITESPLQVVYGIKDDRLLISTATVWGEDDSSVSDSKLYKNLSGHLSDVDEGLFLVDTKGLADFVGGLRALREQLHLQVSEEALSVEDFLKAFEGAIGQGHSEAYEATFNGYLKLAE